MDQSLRRLKKRLDDLWAKIVKILAGNRCEKCGRSDTLNSHHVFSRSNHSVRWDFDNGVCLCAGCHCLNNDSAHKAPLEFAEWFKKKRGEKIYEHLRIKASQIYKPDYDLISIFLNNELKKAEEEQRRREGYV